MLGTVCALSDQHGNLHVRSPPKSQSPPKAASPKRMQRLDAAQEIERLSRRVRTGFSGTVFWIAHRSFRALVTFHLNYLVTLSILVQVHKSILSN